MHFDPLLLLMPATEVLRALGMYVDLAACRPRPDGEQPTWEEIFAAPITPAALARLETAAAAAAAAAEEDTEAGGEEEGQTRGDGDGHTDEEADESSAGRGIVRGIGGCGGAGNTQGVASFHLWNLFLLRKKPV